MASSCRAGSAGQRRGEHGVAGHEADDHLGGVLEGGPVVLGRQRRDVRLERRRRARAASARARRRAGRRPGPARNAPIGALESMTRYLSPGRRTTTSGRTWRWCRLTRRHLLVEVAPGEQPGVLEHPAQLHLAPGAADGRGVERAGQRLGLAAQRARSTRAPRRWSSRAPRTGWCGRARACRPAARPGPRASRRGEQRRRGLGVVGDRGLEVDHALAQQVGLGARRGERGGSRRAARPTSRPRTPTTRPTSEDEHEFHGHDHASRPPTARGSRYGRDMPDSCRSDSVGPCPCRR